MNNRVRLGVNDEQRTAIAVRGMAGKRLTKGILLFEPGGYIRDPKTTYRIVRKPDYLN
jgi:hypothetical protein